MLPGFATVVAILLVLGLPIFLILALPVVGFLGLTTPTPPMLVIQRLFAGIDKFPLMAIPFFILAGNIMAGGGLSRRLNRLAAALVAPLSGGLAMTAVSSSMFFSAISGSSPATVVAVGKLMLPAMDAANYRRPFSIGLLMGSGSLGIILPPSIFMIVYGSVTGVSIGALFIAGIGAGLLYGIAFLLVAYIYARRNGMAGVGSWSRIEILSALRESIWGLAIPFLVLGGIYGGFFTPTEAAAVTVGYATIVSLFIYRELSLRGLWDVLVDSAIVSAQVMLIVASASAFAWYLTTSGFAASVAALLASAGNDPMTVLILVNVVVLIAGMFLDPNSIVIILVPFLYTLAISVGIDPVHLGVMLAINAGIGMFTPPLGLNLFVAGSLGITYSEAAHGSLPFILLAIAVLVVIALVPEISLWLPAQVYPGIGATATFP